MSTRDEIIHLGDTLIRHKSYNAFSFYDIADKVGIKTSSIHYHFPTKSDLAIAVIDQHVADLNRLIDRYAHISPTEKLERLFSIYANIQNENKICLVGSLATDFYTLEKNVQEKLKLFSQIMLDWVDGFLEEGRKKDQFSFDGDAKTRALMVIADLVAIVQLLRLTNNTNFESIKNSIKDQLLKQ